MSEHRYWRRRVVDRVIDQLRRRDSPPRTDREPSRVRGSTDSEPAASRRLAPAEPLGATRSSETPGRNQVSRAVGIPPGRQRLGVGAITEMLELAHTETRMDMAMLGEVWGGREVVRFLAGDGGSFGLSPGASMSIEDTYCHRLLTGRLSNVVADAQANEQVRDLQLTRAGRVGAYIGVPLTGLDARLYVLCCLAHEQRPQLGERDVLFLRNLGEAILAALE